MRTLDQITRGQTDESRRRDIAQDAAALAQLDIGGALYGALHDRFELAIAEAHDVASHPDTPEEKRPIWCGRLRGLNDLWTELEDLRTGAWKDWPEMMTGKREAKRKKEEEAEDE
jgi:hypothetical protein